MPAYAPIAVRFERHYIPEPNSGCWIWMGTVAKSNRSEYGEIGRESSDVKNGKHHMDKAHRVSYEIYKGAIPAGHEVDHICTNTLCVNPDHLQVVTSGKNKELAHLRRYGNACRKGHPLTLENTWLEKGKKKRCRQCFSESHARSKQRKKEQFACHPL